MMLPEPHIVASLGNMDFLKLHKTAFLCSRNVPASVVLKCFDWAIAQREAGKCVISGFHSRLEKDVLAYLLKGKQPVVVVLGRGMKQRIEPELKKALAEERLLIVTPFERDVKWVTTEQAMMRNSLMLHLAQDIVIGYAKPEGNVAFLIKQLNLDRQILCL